MPTTPKKHDRILIKISVEDKKEIRSSIEDGELSEVTRILLLMYARDPVLQVKVQMLQKPKKAKSNNIDYSNINWQNP